MWCDFIGPRMSGLYHVGLLVFAAFGIFWGAIALHLRSPEIGFNHSAVGALGVAGAIGALSANRAGRLADRGLASQVTGLGFMLLAASWIVLAKVELPSRAGGLVVALFMLVLGVIVLDLAGQAIHVTNQWYVSRIDAAAQSRLVACYMLFYSAGIGAGAAAATFTFEHGGWSAVCTLGGAVSVAGLLLWIATRRQMSPCCARA